MTTSENGRAMITRFEGVRLTAYQDQRGIWTIGVGHTPAHEGQTITAAEADEMLEADLATAEECVTEACKVEVSQQQFDAMVSLAFNVGCHAFWHSTLVRLVNEGETVGAANQFLAWVRLDGKINQGLDYRRATERKVFLYGYGPLGKVIA